MKLQIKPGAHRTVSTENPSVVGHVSPKLNAKAPCDCNAHDHEHKHTDAEEECDGCKKERLLREIKTIASILEEKKAELEKLSKPLSSATPTEKQKVIAKSAPLLFSKSRQISSAHTHQNTLKQPIKYATPKVAKKVGGCGCNKKG